MSATQFFLQRGWRHNGDLHFFSKVHDRDTESFPAKKKNTHPPPQLTLSSVSKFRRRTLNGTHVSIGVLRGSTSLSSTLVVVSSCSARDLSRLCRDGVSTFPDQPRCSAACSLLPCKGAKNAVADVGEGCSVCWILQPPPLPRSGKLRSHP